jgi:hypothetical protein
MAKSTATQDFGRNTADCRKFTISSLHPDLPGNGLEQDDERDQDLIKLLSAIMREKNNEIVFQAAILRHKYSSTHNCVSVTQASERGL